MASSGRLFTDYCDALNAELKELGCELRVARVDSAAAEAILLLDAAGHELGWLPDHADAPLIAALGKILKSHGTTEPHARRLAGTQLPSSCAR